MGWNVATNGMQTDAKNNFGQSWAIWIQNNVHGKHTLRFDRNQSKKMIKKAKAFWISFGSIKTRKILAVTRGTLDLKCSNCTAILARISKVVDMVL